MSTSVTPVTSRLWVEQQGVMEIDGDVQAEGDVGGERDRGGLAVGIDTAGDVAGGDWPVQNVSDLVQSQRLAESQGDAEARFRAARAGSRPYEGAQVQGVRVADEVAQSQAALPHPENSAVRSCRTVEHLA
ncbi:hypothetical protein ACQEUU_19430 [Nonomuraea sp. CA-218870]|uniref:hypothetical protein n=1 Tax=Nonomuraea sp. CA-218870 TaxID=3239998 RepID=UPI003D9434C8